MTNDIFQSLERAMQRRMAALPQRLRLFTTEHESLPAALLLTGARGCGKSTFLLYHSRKFKKPKASDYVLRDNTDYPAGNALPFWLLAMMW